MARFDKNQPWHEVRYILRGRLSRFLATPQRLHAPTEAPLDASLSDDEMVELYLHLDYLPGNDVTRLKGIYAAESIIQNEYFNSRDSTQEELDKATANEERYRLEGLNPPPSFEQLEKSGWLRIVWGRVYISDKIRDAVRQSKQPEAMAFKAMTVAIFDDKFVLKENALQGDALQLANQIVAEEIRLIGLTCPSPQRVAAKLLKKWSAEEDGLSRWIDAWRHLNYPAFSLSQLCGTELSKSVINEALTLIESGSPNWPTFYGSEGSLYELLYIPGRFTGSQPM
jgi:hypothetical protein